VYSFSTLQRVEIAEIAMETQFFDGKRIVSVLFNESKLLKFKILAREIDAPVRFSTLQRVEIAEIPALRRLAIHSSEFQYSSTSRNC